MTKKRSTKRALLLSALSLLMCVSMLVGSTFAWFTDSVTSGNNIIKAGNLDIELDYKKVVDGVATEWASVKDRTDIFDPNALWEPGHVEVVYLRVANKGSLELKYQLGVNFKDTAIGKTEDGKEIKLSDHLVFATVASDAEKIYANRDEVVKAAAGTEKGLKDYNGKTTALEVGGEDYLALIVYMPETVGNEANYRGTDVPTIELGINLYATQYTAEEDSFDEFYDEDAWHNAMKVYNANDLQAALNNAEPGDVIALENDIELTEAVTIPAAPATFARRSAPAPVVINLNGKTLTGVGVDANGKKAHAIINNGNAVIVNGTITSSGVNGGSAIYTAEGSALVLEDVNIIGSSQSGSGWPSYAINSYGELTINSANITSTHGAIALYGDTVINDANVTMNGFGGSSHVFYIGGEGTDVVVNGGTYTHKGNVDGSLAYIMTGTTMTVNGGTFSASNGGYGMATYTGELIINGGTFANAPINWGGPITITGGTFASKPDAKYIADGYKAVANTDGTYTVLFPQESFDALIENAGTNGTIEIPAGSYIFPTSKLEAGMTLNCAPGTVFEGTSKLNIKGATIVGATFSNPTGTAADQTIDGKFVDCVFEGQNGLRWCYAGDTVEFENCVFSGSTYGVHFDGGAKKVTFKDCTISGFNATAGSIENITFDGCTFVGNGKSAYNGINLWGNGDFKDCTFVFDGSTKNEWIDLCGAEKTATFTNCVVTNGTTTKDIAEVVSKRNDNATIIVNGSVVAHSVANLDDALASGENAVLIEDMKFSSSDTKANSGYGATGVSVMGGVLDGNGHKLGINNWGTWDAAVHTTGGTIKNLTINSGMRGIFMGSATADVKIDNVTIDGTIYTFNSDGGNKNYGVYISNSTLNGWTSHSDVHKEVVYTNCSFGEGQGYAFCRPYGPTQFIGCKFAAGFRVDAVGAVTFENCTIGGVALTAANLNTLVTSGIANATVK